MAESTEVKKARAYTEDDFVFVQDAGGVVQVDSVPKAWIGTDLLPAGWKKADEKPADTSDPADDQQKPADELPALSVTRPELEAYAVAHGLTDEEAKAFPNKEELHAALVKAAEDSKA